MIEWMENIDLSNVFKNEIEDTARNLAYFEFFQTLPTIGYLFLVYFFIVDIRQFYKLQDGSIAEFILSVYTVQGLAWIDFGINWTNNLMV